MSAQRLLLSILAVLMMAPAILAASPATPAAAGTASFDDVSEDAFFAEPVAALTEWDVFSGTECGQNLLCPSESLDRKTMAVWIVRVLSLQDPAAVSESSFLDVEAESFHASYIERMAEMGITTGCGDGTRFCPDGTVTRAQMAAFLSRAYALPDAPDPGFPDVPEDAWYASSVARLTASGITSGCGDGTRFCPDRHTTRGEMATFLARAARLVRGPGSADGFDSAIAVDAAEVSAAIANIDVEVWAAAAAPYVSEPEALPEALTEILALVDADQVAQFLSGIDTAAIDAAARAVAADNARAAAFAVRIGYETSMAWEDRQAAVNAAMTAARLAVPLNPDPVEFDRVRSFDRAAYAAAYDDYFADPEFFRGTDEESIVRTAAYARTRAAKAARAAARTAAIAAAAPVFATKAEDDVLAAAYYDAATDTYTDHHAFFNAYPNTRQAVRRLRGTANTDVAVAYDEAYVSALGVEVERPSWWDDGLSTIEVYERHIHGMKLAIEYHERRFGGEIEVPPWPYDDDDQVTATIAEYETDISAIESAVAAHEEAYGVNVRVPGPRELQNSLEAEAAWNRVRHYYNDPILLIVDAFTDTRWAYLRQQENELFERRNDLSADDPEIIAIEAARSAYFHGTLIDDRGLSTGTYRKSDSYYSDPGSAAAAAYLATYYNTYSIYVGSVVGQTTFLGVNSMLFGAVVAAVPEARVVDSNVARVAAGRAVNRLVGAELGRRVMSRFDADHAANSILGAYEGSDVSMTVWVVVSSEGLLSGCVLRSAGDQRIVDILSRALNEP